MSTSASRGAIPPDWPDPPVYVDDHGYSWSLECVRPNYPKNPLAVLECCEPGQTAWFIVLLEPGFLPDVRKRYPGDQKREDAILALRQWYRDQMGLNGPKPKGESSDVEVAGDDPSQPEF